MILITLITEQITDPKKNCYNNKAGAFFIIFDL